VNTLQGRLGEGVGRGLEPGVPLTILAVMLRLVLLRQAGGRDPRLRTILLRPSTVSRRGYRERGARLPRSGNTEGEARRPNLSPHGIGRATPGIVHEGSLTGVACDDRCPQTTHSANTPREVIYSTTRSPPMWPLLTDRA